jgi:5-guanidino-2-oxopentanoate decarboxylase
VRAAAPSTETLAAAVALLEAAERPVILAGGGSLDAAVEVSALAHKLAAPVITTIAGKGVIPDGHPLSLGAGLQRAGPRAFLAAADLVVAVGTELSAPDLHMWDAQARKLEARLGTAYEGPTGLALSGKLLRIDIDGAILAGDQRADLVMKADAAEALTRLGEALVARPEAARAKVAAEVAEIREGLRDDLTALEKKHVAVLDALRAALPDDGFVCSDMTQIAYTANTTFEARCPRSYFHPVGYGTLGYALPAAIGAKLAAPERAAVALVGDGGLLFTIQELATAPELRQPLAVVLWNNEALGEIEDSMIRQGIPTISVRPETPDFQALARAFNCRACRPESLAAFQEELTAAFAADRPTLIELRQDAAYLP